MPPIYQAGTPQITNLTLTNADTEYTHAFGAGIKKICLQARGSVALKFAFSSGQSGSTYFTLKAGSAWFEDLIKGPFTIYLQSPSAGTVVEILEWQAND
jgi:hypothetical protein